MSRIYVRNCRTLGRFFTIHNTQFSFPSLVEFTADSALSLSLSHKLLLFRCELLAAECVVRNEPKIKLLSTFPSPFTRCTSGSRRRYQQTVRTPNTRNSLVAVNKTFPYTFATNGRVLVFTMCTKREPVNAKRERTRKKKWLSSSE